MGVVECGENIAFTAGECASFEGFRLGREAGLAGALPLATGTL
jgi:hypothetical protein